MKKKINFSNLLFFITMGFIASAIMLANRMFWFVIAILK